MGGLDDDGSSPPTIPSMGGDFLNGEGNATAARTTKDALTLMWDQSSLENTMRLKDLKTKREKERIIARALCKEATATLGLSMTSSGVGDVLATFLHELRKNEVRLRLLNEEIEPLIDIDHLDQEFATNIEYEDEIFHVMCRIYYQLKGRKCDVLKQSQIFESLNLSTSFREYLTTTERFYDPDDLKNSREASMTETPHASQLLPQVERDNATALLAELDFQAEDALLSCAIQETADVSTSKSTPLTAAQALFRECFQTEITDAPPREANGKNNRQVLATKRQSIVDSEERSTDHHERNPKRIAVACVLQHRRRLCGKRPFKTRNASRNDGPTRKVKTSRKKHQGAKKVFSGRDVYKLVEYTSEFRGVEDLLRISDWLRRLHRLYLPACAPKTAPDAASPTDCLRVSDM